LRDLTYVSKKFVVLGVRAIGRGRLLGVVKLLRRESRMLKTGDRARGSELIGNESRDASKEKSEIRQRRNIPGKGGGGEKGS